ncbi:MAG: hypothetical protein PT977_14570 [Acidobacteriota bacterium]|nr:hypothetical protein [Acidobacteriota bacterium]
MAAGLLSRPAEAQTGLQFYAVTPCRAADTRSGFGGIMSASTQRNFTIKGVCGVPVTAKAVSLNVTVVGPTQDGFVSLWPTGGTFPVVSTVNFNAGEPALANGAIVPLAVATPDLATVYGTGSGSGTIHTILDVTGYFQ